MVIDYEINEGSIQYLYSVTNIGGPFWSFAIHDGHHLSKSIRKYLNLNNESRLREEDPYTADIASIGINQLVISTSRFQLDVNRPKLKSVYKTPDLAWGLQTWKEDLPQELLQDSYRVYDRFYAVVDQVISETINKYGHFVVYDIHSYNAKRESPEAIVDQNLNPEINFGTQSINAIWVPLVDRLMDCMKFGSQNVQHDVRENIKFKGGQLSKYINTNFGEKGCAIAIEFRKDFMDEWTGCPYPDKINSYKQLLYQSVSVLKDFFHVEK